jgi:hypothetical protein
VKKHDDIPIIVLLLASVAGFVMSGTSLLTGTKTTIKDEQA